MVAVEAAYTAALAPHPPEIVAAGRRLWERIASPQWALEWALPRWLGDAFGLPSETSHALVSANVLGLGYVRLQDDLVDGDVDPAGRATATCLAAALYHQAIRRYTRLFASDSPFWSHLDGWMGQWLQAILHGQPSPARPFSAYQDEDYLRLAARGAPLKICVAAACLLAGRAGAIPSLASAIDHLLVGAVLLDHADDWERDLAEGRYNAFVAYASPMPQEPVQREENRRNVLAELWLGGGGRAYFDVVRDHIRLAGRIAQPWQVSGLSAYLLWLDAQAHTYGQELADGAQAILRKATTQVFGGYAAEPPNTEQERG
jgi:hypothetical protein